MTEADSTSNPRHGHNNADLLAYLTTYAAGARSRLLGRFVCLRLIGSPLAPGLCDCGGLVVGVDRVGIALEVDADVSMLIPWASVELVEFVSDDLEVPA